MLFLLKKTFLNKIKERCFCFRFPSILSLLLSGMIAFSLSGCVQQASVSPFLEKTSFAALSGWEREDHRTLLSLMWRQCHRLSQLPPEAELGGEESFSSGQQAGAWGAACAALPQSDQVSAAEARHYFETWFTPYFIKKKLLYTGYYEAEIEASLERQAAYRYPLYHRPSDLKRVRDAQGKVIFGREINGVLTPYDSRVEIDHGSLADKALEVAWLKDPISVFFLQLQGSGRLRLPNGHVIRVAYDGQNGQKYVPIGQILLKKSALKPNELNEDSIRLWLSEHPEQVSAVLEQNPNYVFFHIVEHSSSEGPIGTFGLPLILGRSLAVDRRFIPLASLIWVETPMVELPQNLSFSQDDFLAKHEVKKGQWHHLVFAQDGTSNAKGQAHAELFTGWGEKAHFFAENLHDEGKMFLLLPRGADLSMREDMPASQPVASQEKQLQEKQPTPVDVSAYWSKKKI